MKICEHRKREAYRSSLKVFESRTSDGKDVVMSDSDWEPLFCLL